MRATFSYNDERLPDPAFKEELGFPYGEASLAVIAASESLPPDQEITTGFLWTKGGGASSGHTPNSLGERLASRPPNERWAWIDADHPTDLAELPEGVRFDEVIVCYPDYYGQMVEIVSMLERSTVVSGIIVNGLRAAGWQRHE